MKLKPKDVTRVAAIVKERSGGRIPIHNKKQDHEKQKRSRQACCWGTAIVVDGYEISACQPSARHKGDPLVAFFTFKKVGGQ